MSVRRSRDLSGRSVMSPRVHYHVLMSPTDLLVVRHSYVWRPPTDVMEDEDRLIVIVEVAGMRDGEFHVTIAGQRLTISGVRPVSASPSSAYHQLEVHYGEFRTDVALPWPVDEERIVARYDDGFLRVELPRAQPQRIRVIAVDKATQREDQE